MRVEGGGRCRTDTVVAVSVRPKVRVVVGAPGRIFGLVIVSCRADPAHVDDQRVGRDRKSAGDQSAHRFKSPVPPNEVCTVGVVERRQFRNSVVNPTPPPL